MIYFLYYCTGWIDASPDSGITSVIFCKLSLSKDGETEQALVTLKIHQDFTWTVLVKQQCVEMKTCTFVNGLISHLTSVDAVVTVTLALEGSAVCTGNPDEKFKVLLPSRKYELKDKSGKFKDLYGNNYIP